MPNILYIVAKAMAIFDKEIWVFICPSCGECVADIAYEKTLLIAIRHFLVKHRAEELTGLSIAENIRKVTAREFMNLKKLCSRQEH